MYDGRVQEYFNEQECVDTHFEYVLYWMQQSQRVDYNHALNYAIELANSIQLPVVVFFGIAPQYPEANARHYHFMFEGLIEVKSRLEAQGITCVFRLGSPEKSIEPLLHKTHTLIMDKGYLRHQREWRHKVAEYAKAQGVRSCIEVESDVIVPVEIASTKEEYMARTIRPKIEKLISRFALPLELLRVTIRGYSVDIDDPFEITDYKSVISLFDIDHSIKKSPIYQGGSSEAFKLLDEFLFNHLGNYDESNDPGWDITSKMSMYLHFGQISSLQIYQYVQNFLLQSRKDIDVRGFFEQLIVRRELAVNYVYYRSGYDQFETMTNPWAYITMEIHSNDTREVVYSIDEMIQGRTHDPYFNAAMKEMVDTGYMHGYMRMYWCKKIIEWSKDYKSAYNIAILLNNRYFIDGRDPNSYVGVAWCFGLHDQGFRERPIFGKLRFMSSNGLKTKFNMKAYIERTKYV